MSKSQIFKPPEWADDQKMAVMFAPFRDKSLNPQSWDRKVKFWTHVISEDCRNNNNILVDVKTLQSRFVRNGKKPGCLDVVLAEMQRNGKLHQISQYQTMPSGWIGWGFNTFIRAPVSWGLRTIWKPTETTGPLVLHEVLREKCEEMLENHYKGVEHESTDNVVELSVFRSRHENLSSSEQEFHLMLQKLQQDRKVIVTQTMEKDTVVKICKKGDKHVNPVSDLELNIFRIQKVQKNLENQTEVLSHQCDKLSQEAKSYVKEGRKTQALQTLRRKKRVERTLSQKMASIDQLHNMMTKIEDAATSDMILKAYEYGMNAIRTLNQATPVNKVENVIDNLQDALEDQGEITQLLSQDVSSSDLAPDDLEKELSDLLVADQRTLDVAELMENLSVQDSLPSLPDVPSFSPSKGDNSVPGRKTASQADPLTN